MEFSGMAFILIILGISVMSYLFGSISFAVIVSRLYAKDDVRLHGSKNAGMTNILRTYGILPAIYTILGDFTKGIAAVLLSRLIFSALGFTGIDVGYISGLCVIIGHVYPVFFGFRGGKGVLTSLGILLILNPVSLIIVGGVFIPLAFITKIVSLSSVLGALCYPIVSYFVLSYTRETYLFELIMSSVIAIIILIMHKDNIKRLLNGTENKFGGVPKKK